jgi:hypothetical protein
MEELIIVKPPRREWWLKKMGVVKHKGNEKKSWDNWPKKDSIND